MLYIIFKVILSILSDPYDDGVVEVVQVDLVVEDLGSLEGRHIGWVDMEVWDLVEVRQGVLGSLEVDNLLGTHPGVDEQVHLLEVVGNLLPQAWEV